MPTWSLTARWILPVDRPPLAHGVVVITDDKIAVLETRGRRTADIDLGNTAIIPGLVNAHTHLDLTDLRGQCTPTPDFTQWLRGVITHRRRQTPDQIAAAIQMGTQESIAAGTTLLGDIAAGGASWNVLAQAQVRTVVFYEVLGLLEKSARHAEDAVHHWLDTHPPTLTSRPGISPHAPYSVRQSLLVAAACLAHDFHAALAIHLAESLPEIELLHHHRGPFVDFLRELGVWDKDGLIDSPKRVMRTIYFRAKPRLFVHCNYLAPSARIPRGSVIIYCPRTHAAFGHPPHPFREFLRRGVRVALGTDSLASNPDLSILAEMRFIHQRYPDFPGDLLLRMGTLSGAEALGWADETGSLTPGKSADLAVVPLPHDKGDPHHLLLASSRAVARTMFRGQWVHP
jgi:aminodeoxyfutalosine deaminase